MRSNFLNTRRPRCALGAQEVHQRSVRWRVPMCMIGCMKKCLARNPKESDDSRASGAGVARNERRYVARVPLPSLFLRPYADWSCYLFDGSGESPSSEPTQKPELAEDETIINPYHMHQLLQYGICLGQQQNSANMSPEDLLREATVRFHTLICSRGFSDDILLLMISGWSQRSKQSHETTRHR
jgi:hypothetical protein